MTNAQWIASVRRIKDPMKMLRAIVDNENYLGFDPYYRDIRAALIETATKIVKETK